MTYKGNALSRTPFYQLLYSVRCRQVFVLSELAEVIAKLWH